MTETYFPRRLVAAALAAAFAVPANSAADVEAKLQICGSCHGEFGRPGDPTIPIIRGQQKAYLEKQLRDYKSGDRDSHIMSSMAESLKKEEIPDAAAFFADNKWPNQPGSVPGTRPDAIAACEICHLADFLGGVSGGETAPRLAGQNREYLADTMREFANGERGNHAVMSALTKGLPGREREAIARYLSALGSAERDRQQR